MKTSNSHNDNTSRRRAIVVALCLAACGVACVLLLGGNRSRAATPQGRTSPDGIWQDVEEGTLATRSEREVAPNSYRTMRLNGKALEGLIAQAPMEFTEAVQSKPVELTLPLPDGTFSRFRIVESPMLEKKTAEQFPEIKNYSGQGVDDPSATMRFDLTINGFHAIILSTAGSIFISPYAQGDTEHYISYFLHDDPKNRADTCAVADGSDVKLSAAQEIRPNTFNQGELRTYFLAAAATAEYTQQFRTAPGDSDATLQARAMGDINTTIMSVNAIYNRDFAIRLTVIGGTNIIFTDTTTDQYTSGDLTCDNDPMTFDCLTEQNQANLDRIIGPANYDIGHVFDRGNAGGGGAGRGEIAQVCQAGQKGKGTTGGRTSFVLAAHEIGHQFGGRHTFNGNAFGACASQGGGPQRTADSAYEPASGSSIMSYGGTCTDMNGTDDLQNNRDLFFNASSLEQIVFYTTNGNGNTCPVITNTGNNGISMSFSPVIDVPVQTPFQLFVGAEDIDAGTGTPTVSWEEYDLGPASPPNEDDGERPIFRVYPPVASPTRNFPHLTYILNNDNNPPATYQGVLNLVGGQVINCGNDATGNPNTCVTGESLPRFGRPSNHINKPMVFKAVARDNDSRGGAINIVTARVNIIASAGPFKVTEPSDSAPPDWARGSRRSVRWLTANTQDAPINCARVRITLSTDGGLTFPIVLAGNTPNDGVETVLLPEDAPLTATARVRVESIIEGNSHRFFDISNRNFNIVSLSVTNTADSGPGSLRQAIMDANSDPGLSRITFDIREGFGVETINLTTELPLIIAPAIVDGWSQGGAGYTGPPLIQLNGASVSPGFINNGLTISGGNTTIIGLIINRFSGSGIDIRTNGGNKIFGCYIGTNANGTTVQGNGRSGILISDTPNNEIGRRVPSAENIIAGNDVGVRIVGTNARGNEVRNNYIGTNAAGTDLGNTLDGVLLEGAPLNLIGGTRNDGGYELPTRNVISGNGTNNFTADGIEITGTGAFGNTIQGNLIGLNPPGTAPLHNLGSGIQIINAPNTVIGGGTSAESNVITGLVGGGRAIYVTGIGAELTLIQGNYVGTNAAGTAALPNNNAINIGIESANNQIRGNLISGQGVTGVHLTFGGATGNSIQGNYIGTNAAGTAGLSAGGTGIEARGGANNNTIGGMQAGMGSSGNFTGVFVISSSNNVIQGNYVGTNPEGTEAVPNVIGIVIDGGANNQIGGTIAAARNVISANGTGGNDHGIRLANTSNAVVEGNRIGTNAAGTAALGNGGHGIQVFNSTNCRIGGSTTAARNLISANRGNGISLGSGSNSAIVQGNYIGTDVNGTANFGNGQTTGAAGIEIQDGGHTIGGAGAGEGNTIAFSGCAGCSGVNRGSGLRLLFGTGNRIRGNSIFGNVELGIDLSGGAEGANRVTPNDSCDTDAGPNNLQNFPVITSAVNTGASMTIQGTLNSAASGAFTIDFYSNPACDASGNGEGKTYLGSTTVNTDAGCNALINFTLPVSVPGGQFITATATDSLGNTSEVSSCIAVLSSIPTPAGNNVVVKSSGVMLNFPVVTAAGSTSITSIDPGSAGSLPGGYSLCEGCPAFDITTTASYIPPVGVCMDVSASIDQQTFNSLKLLHGENGVLVDRTTGRQTDPQTGVRSVCGSVSSLSPFLIAQGPAPSPSPTPTPTPLASNLQFSSSNYNGAEDCAATVITITRTGDSSSAVSVDYATSDGSALQKADYTIALGTLNFASGETSRSFVALITEDAYLEGTETATITLSNPTGGAVLGSQSSATLTILDDASETAGNPIDLAGSYVCQHYHDFLNREPDAAGLAFWTNEITSCGTDAPCIERKRINISAAYFLSIEFQQTGYLVYRFYNAAVNRSNGLPRYLEFLRDTQAVGRGVVVLAPGWEAQLEANKVAFASEFVTRGEFTALYQLSQTPAQFVDALYAHALVTPSAAERQAAIDEFAGAATSADMASRGRVLRRVAENQMLYQREFNRAFVLMQYFGYLRRNPDDLPDTNLDGYNFWLTKLNQFNGDFVAAEMVKAFITSGEYRQRFGP